jgi:very-short-patch-repair endonuclease
MRLGFELRTGLRFAAPGGRPSRRQASLERDGDVLARLTYGHAATLWRINLGWRRRRNQAQQGFVLDIERGYWATNDQAPDPDGDDGDSLSQRTARVIPYVEDRRNCLLVAPSEPLETAAMASLQAALKNAIQVVYQLEDNELAAEPLPFETDRRLLLFYESAEGGAGVLRRLLDDPAAFARVAREALSICHFDPDTGEDLHRGPRAREDCEAACYDCLMSYTNQRDHALLDRRAIQNLLFRYAQAHVVASPVELPRAEHLANLLNRADSELERRWLQFIDERAFPLPSASQVRIERCGTRPDFLYEEHVTAVYVDGPVHDFPDRQARDREAMERMADAGYTVIRFGHQDDWPAIVAGFPSIFAAQDGEQRAAAAPSAPSAARASLPDLDLFDPRWHELILVLAQRDDLTVEEGGDIAGTQGTVIGRYEAEVVRGGRRVRLLAGGDSAVDATVSSEGAVRYMRVEPAPVEGAIAAILASLESAS